MLVFRMLLAGTNKVRRLLLLSFIGQVTLEELQRSRNEVQALLTELPAGFCLLTDLSHLQSMEIACEAEIAQMMQLFDRKGLSAVVRVIPEPKKDIGFNILTALHYQRQLQVFTCKSMEEAVGVMKGLSDHGQQTTD